MSDKAIVGQCAIQLISSVDQLDLTIQSLISIEEVVKEMSTHEEKTLIPTPTSKESIVTYGMRNIEPI